MSVRILQHTSCSSSGSTYLDDVFCTGNKSSDVQDTWTTQRTIVNKNYSKLSRMQLAVHTVYACPRWEMQDIQYLPMEYSIGEFFGVQQPMAIHREDKINS